MSNISRLPGATEVTPEVLEELEELSTSHPWTPAQLHNASQFRILWVGLMAAIIKYVPPSADRSAAMRKLREVRMDCNHAITHEGRY